MYGWMGVCCDVIKVVGIMWVVVGVMDLFVEYVGCGFVVLWEFGVEVMSGVLVGECVDLNLIFNYWIV